MNYDITRHLLEGEAGERTYTNPVPFGSKLADIHQYSCHWHAFAIDW